MTKANKIRKSMFALLVALVFAGLSIFPAFFKTKAAGTTGAEEYANRETVIYPSTKTLTTFMSENASNDALFYWNKNRIKEPVTGASQNAARFYNGDDGNGNKINSAALVPNDSIARVGAIETPDTLDATLLSKDYDITWVVSAPGKLAFNKGHNWGDAFTFFNFPSFSSNTSFDYGALGIYNKNYQDPAYKQLALSNSIAVEIDNWNDVYPNSEGNSARLDELWKETDENGKDLPDGADLPRTDGLQVGHVAITIPEESKKAKDANPLDNWKQKDTNGVRLPHYSARLMKDTYTGSRLGKRRIHTIRIKWQLIDAGKTGDVTDNVYRLTYYMYNNQNQCTGLPVTGKKDFTYAQIKKTMGWADGDTEGKAKMAIWGTSATSAGVSRRHFFPATYNYTVKYINKKTRKPLKPEYKGNAPAGPLTVKAPQIEGYKLVSKSPIERNISSWGQNNIVFYYQSLNGEDPTEPNRPNRPNRPGNNNHKRQKFDFASFFGNCKKRPLVNKMSKGKKGKSAVNTGFGLSAAAFGVIFALSGGALAIASKKRND